MFKILIGLSAIPITVIPISINETTDTDSSKHIESIERYDAHEKNKMLTLKPTIYAPPVPLPPPTVEELYPLESLPQDWQCLQYFHTSLHAGWTVNDWPRLGEIMWRESRCVPTACGETDSPHIRKCRDWGLMQINDYSWKRIIREMGWSIEQMHDPLENLKFARWLFEYSEKYNNDGWQPWTPSKYQ